MVNGITVNSMSNAEGTRALSQFELDATLDLQMLKDGFKKKGRLYIPMILRTVDAQRLHNCLHRDMDWGMLVCAGPSMGRQYISPDKIKTLAGIEERTLLDAAYAHAGKCGSHIYDSTPLHQRELQLPPAMAQFLSFLNSNTFLEFVRAVTGMEDITRASAQAVRFRIGHFFGFHVDVDRPGKQRASCVFNLSDHWMAQWGGLLQFKGADGHIDEAYVPRFNSLSIFAASQEHAVSCVSPAADRARYSVSVALIAE